MNLKHILLTLCLALFLLAACQTPPRTSSPRFLEGTLQLEVGEQFSPQSGDIFTATVGGVDYQIRFVDSGLVLPYNCSTLVISPRIEIRCDSYEIMSSTVVGNTALYAAGSYGGRLTRQ